MPDVIFQRILEIKILISFPSGNQLIVWKENQNLESGQHSVCQIHNRPFTEEPVQNSVTITSISISPGLMPNHWCSVSQYYQFFFFFFLA